MTSHNLTSIPVATYMLQRPDERILDACSLVFTPFNEIVLILPVMSFLGMQFIIITMTMI